MKVIKKDGTLEVYDEQKIINACNKAARRAMIELSEKDYQIICKAVWEKLVENDLENTQIYDMHNIVESVLEDFYPVVAKMYKEYRNYKKDFVHMMDKVYEKSQSIRYVGDKSNANTDSALVATKRSLIFNELNRELYQKFFMTKDERQACKDGYIYIHDQSARLDTMNCFRRDTRFITELGVKSFYDFKDGDSIRVLSHRGNWKKAIVRSYGWQPINKVTLKREKGKTRDVFCTANHRWILKKGQDTTELKIGDKLIAAPDISSYDWNNLSKLEKSLWCIGFGIADGAVVNDNAVPTMILRLCGEKTYYASRFEDVGYTATYPKSLNGDACIRMVDIHTKELPWLILNISNIKYLVDGYLCADGNKSLSENFRYRGVQVTGKLNKYIYDLLNISGYYVSSIRDLTGQETNYGVRTAETLNYQICSNQSDRTWSVQDIQEDILNPRAQVWCLEVEDDHSFILEGGIPTGNCCLFDMSKVMSGGFEMGNVWYNEPNSLDTAFDVMGDIILSTAAQQYGGFTVPEVDKILEPYAEKSYWKYRHEYASVCGYTERDNNIIVKNTDGAEAYAMNKVMREFEQGWQGIEYKLNTVGSSRGDYPFVTMTFGLSTARFGKMASITFLNVHKEGQGKSDNKKPVLFPKLVFLYDENIHGAGKECEDVFDAGVECSMKTMYPDWLSLTGDGYVASMYKQYGRVVSPMGCVDGKEVVTYNYLGRLYVESFERMWNRLSDYFSIYHQSEGSPHLYMDLKGVNIYDTKKGFVETKRIIRNVSKDWVDVHLSNGRRLLCTSDHPLTTTDGITKRADSMIHSDEIIINSSQFSQDNIKFNNDKAWLLGFLLCDGCYQSNRISASIAASGEDEIEKKFHEVFPCYFEMKTRTVLQKRGEKGIYKELVAEADQNRSLNKAINYLTVKFGGINKVNRHIPSEVYEWNEESKLAFMAGMIDADGYINPTSHGGSIIQIGSTNKELALQQMVLAQALGMPAKLYHNHYSKKNPIAIRYRVEFFPTRKLLSYIICKKKIDKFKDVYSNHYIHKAQVVEVFPVERTAYSYDVTTESGHFEVSGIYSHNCRAFLSPWYERGGMEQADRDDKPVFAGRFNLGAISLNLPMILAKSRRESKDFYEVLEYYLGMIRGVHQRTYDYLGELRASTNPLAYCEGGFYGGNLKPTDKIKPILKPMTLSFGFTALNELQKLYNGKSLVEDGQFAIEVMEYINKRITEYKKEDGLMYAIYATPAESLCGLQVEQFRKQYGIVPGVSDRTYVSNSFHCAVWEDISPIQKQDLEGRFWDLSNGGKIQYCRYPINYNREAVVTLIRRAMKFGYYEGINLSLAYCEDCGYQELEMNRCPKCGSKNLTKIDRIEKPFVLYK